MSRMRDLLGPSTVAVPDELERAWTWMEDRGHGLATEHGYFLTPYPGEAELGVVFTDSVTLDHWFPDDVDPVVFDRLVPLATISGDGSMAALWSDDDGQVRVVALESEGSAYVLADSALDFLRLCAVGYRDLIAVYLGAEPDDPEAIAAVAKFRTWVEQTFDTKVPEEWPQVGEDEFTDWLNAAMGIEPEGPAAGSLDELARGELSAEIVGGDAAVILASLGAPDGLDRIVDLLELPNARSTSLTKVGLEINLHRKSPETVFLQLTSEPRKPAYPRADRLFANLTGEATPDQVVERFGEPERRGQIAPGEVLRGTALEMSPEVWVRYVVRTDSGPRHLRLAFVDERLTRVTFMDLTRSQHLL